MRNTFLHQLPGGFVLLKVAYRVVATSKVGSRGVEEQREMLISRSNFAQETLFGYVPGS